MSGIVEVMKKVVEQEANKQLVSELGIVSTVFPHKDDGDTENYQCSVKLKNKKLPDGSEFELRKVPVAVPYLGYAAIPNVGDLVLVQFVGGDINAPIITHRLYNDEDRPPVNLEDEFLIQHKIDEGGSIKIDKDGKILLTTKDEKTVLTVEDEKVSVENENHKLIIDISGEKISMQTTGNIEVKADGDTKIESGGNIEVKAGGDAKIESGGNTEVKSGGDAKVEASGKATIAGKMGGVTLESGDAIAWQPNTLPACLFTGAPHSTIKKLKGQ